MFKYLEPTPTATALRLGVTRYSHHPCANRTTRQRSRPDEMSILTRGGLHLDDAKLRVCLQVYLCTLSTLRALFVTVQARVPGSAATCNTATATRLR